MLKKGAKHIILAILLLLITQSVSANDFLISDKTWRKLKNAQTLIDDKNYNKALDILAAIRPQQRYKNYEQSLIYQNLAYVYQLQGASTKAIEYYKKCLDLSSLPKAGLEKVKVDLMVLYSQEKDYKSLIELYQDWQGDSPAIRMLAAYAYYALDQFDDSQNIAEKIVLERKAELKESWLLLLLDIYQKKSLWEKQVGLLNKLISVNSKKEQYWLALSNAYLQQSRKQSAVSVVELAIQADVLSSEAGVLFASDVLIKAGLPFQAAELIETYLTKGIVRNNTKNRNTLVSLYTMAKEYDKAIALLSSKIEPSGDPKDIVLLAQLMIQEQYWDQLLKLDIDKYKDEELKKRLRIFKVQAYIAKGDLTAAKSVLKLGVDKKSKDWIAFVDNEIKRQTQLEKVDLLH